MKKLIALLLASLMLLLVSCSGKSLSDISAADAIAVKTGKAPEQSSTVAQNQPQQTAPDPTQAVEPMNGAPDPVPPVLNEDLTYFEGNMFSVGYNEDDKWVQDDDDAYYDDDMCFFKLSIPGEDDTTENSVTVLAEIEDAVDFRDDLKYYGFDHRDFVDGKYDSQMLTIGGQEMLCYQSPYGNAVTYFGRSEGAGVSYTIMIDEFDDERVKPIIDSLNFTLTDVGNVDFPWYWEGEPYDTDLHTAKVGSYTITSEFLKLDDPLLAESVFDHDVETVEDTVYILTDHKIKVYQLENGTLAYFRDIETDEEYDKVDAGGGVVYFSGFMKDVLAYDGGDILYQSEGPDYLAVAPDGLWGISYFSSGDSSRRAVINYDGMEDGGDFTFDEVGNISSLNIDDNYIYISGTDKSDDEHRVFVYDHKGNLKYKLDHETDGFGLGSVTFAAGTQNGFIAFDGNMREIAFWDNSGEFIGVIEDSELFGTSYPWFAGADLMDDGSILCVMTETRPDKSADELIAFRLTGF